MRSEVETTLDVVEGWAADDQSQDEIREAFPDPRERSDLAKRLYDAANWLSEFALTLWPAEDAAKEAK